MPYRLETELLGQLEWPARVARTKHGSWALAQGSLQSPQLYPPHHTRGGGGGRACGPRG